MELKIRLLIDRVMRKGGNHRVSDLARDLLGPCEFCSWSSSTDRRLGYSGSFTRGIVRSGRRRRALLLVGKGCPTGLADRFLAETVNWWNRLEGRAGPDEMILFVPVEWGMRIRQMLSVLRIPIRCLEYDLASFKGREIYPGGGENTDIDNPYIVYPGSNPPEELKGVGELFPELDLLFRRNRWELSFLGLPVLWSGDRDELWFDFQQPKRYAGHARSCIERIREVEKSRSGTFADTGDFNRRFGAERWLESMLVKNLSLIRPGIGPMFYSQVPTLVDGERRVLDILTVDRRGTLVVLEVKAECRTEDLFQGLVYRRRVAWHQRRGDFRRNGYFPGIELSDRNPVLGFVSPLFAFHSSLPDLWRHLEPGGETFFVGVNTDWRKGLKPLRRFTLDREEKNRECFPYS